MLNKNWLLIGGLSTAVAATLYAIWEPTRKRKRRRVLCCGLENLGNTCFLNAVLQSWASMPSVSDWLTDFLAQRTENSRSHTLPCGFVLGVFSHKLSELLGEFDSSLISDDIHVFMVLCCGLENLGNTCFLNAVLQSWASMPSVSDWLTDFLAQRTENSRSHTLAAPVLRALNVLNNNEDGTDDDVHSPADIIGALRSRRWIISHEEQDAHEMFHVLTTTLDEESVKYPSILPLFDLKSLQNPSNRYQPQHTARTRSLGLLPILPQKDGGHPFRGLLASQLECRECKYRHPVRYDLFDSLSLSFPTTCWVSIRLDELLQKFISPEIVHNVDCPGCSKKQPETRRKPILPSETYKSSCTKKLSIGKLPQCLCIHLQRKQWLDSGMPLKKFEHVIFPDLLYMDNYVYSKTGQASDCASGLLGGKSFFGNTPATPPLLSPTSGPVNLLRALNYDSRITSHGIFLHSSQQSQSTSQSDINHNRPHMKSCAEYAYKLTAVISHLGDECSGHFVTFRRSPLVLSGEKYSSKWLCTSDASVKEVSFDDVLNAEAYMLYYERIVV